MGGNRILALILAMAGLIFIARAALAHKILVDCLVKEEGTVQIEAFFPDGSPAKKVKVEVFRSDGSLFIEGKTDTEGRFFLHPGRPLGPWRVVVTGTMGHAAETQFELTGEVKEKEGPEKAAVSKPEAKRLAHKEATPWFKIIAGLGFIFGLSSFIFILKLRSERKRKNASTRD